MTHYTYNPGIFEAPDEAAAARIILTREDRGTEERWRIETPGLAALAGTTLRLSPQSAVLDYGCGIGRMSKALIARFGCRVTGVDISQRMREMAPGYVGSDRFDVVAPEVFEEGDRRFDAALAVWVLQHCLRPEKDIARLRGPLRPGGRLLVVNTRHRCVPVEGGRWFDDGFDVAAHLAKTFIEIECGELPASLVGESVAKVCFWGLYEAREGD